MLHNHIAFTAAGRAPSSMSLQRPELLRSYSAMVRRIAWSIYRRISSSVELEDLVQVGMLTLIECADGYEDRGFSFATYATIRVRGAMLDQLRKSAPLSRKSMASQRNIAAMRRRLEQRYLRAPTAREMAAAMCIDVASYHQLRSSTVPVESDSIDAIYSDQDSRFMDQEERADSKVQSAQLQNLLETSLATLPERDATILRLVFVEEWNLEKIGQTLGIGAARVCQIKKSALQKLRCELEPAL